MLFLLKVLCAIIFSTIACPSLLAAETIDSNLAIINPAKGNFIYTIKVSEEAARLIKKLEPLAKNPKEQLKLPVRADIRENKNEAVVFEALRVLVKERSKFDKFLPNLFQASLPCLEAFIYLASIKEIQFDLLDYILFKGNKALLERIVECIGIPVGLKDKRENSVEKTKGDSLVFYAVRYAQPEILQYLIQQGASVQELNSDGETLLDELDRKDIASNQSIRQAYKAIRDILEARNVNNSPSGQLIKDGILAEAVAQGEAGLVKRLLTRGKIDINNKVHATGHTPLMIAAQRGLFDIVALLLRYGARVADTNVIGLDAEKMARQALSERKEQLKRPNITEQEKQQKLTEKGNYQKVLNAFTNYALKEFVCIPREEVSLSVKR